MFYYIDVKRECVVQYSPAKREYYFLTANSGDNNLKSFTYHTHKITNENIIMRSIHLYHGHTVIVHDIENNIYFMSHESPKKMFEQRKTPEYIELNSYLYDSPSGIGIEKNAKLELIIVITNSKGTHDTNQICRDFAKNVQGTVVKTNIIYTSALDHINSDQFYEVEFNPHTSMVTVLSAGGFYTETYPKAFENNVPDEVKLVLPEEIAKELAKKLSHKIIEARQLHKKATEGIDKLKYEPQFNNILTKQKGKINKDYETIIRNSIDEIENLFKQFKAPAHDLGSRALFDIYNFLVELSILIGDTVGIASYCSKVAKYSRDMRQAEHDGWARTMSAYAAAAYEALGEYQSAIEFYTISVKGNWCWDTAGQDLIRSKLNQLTKANNSNSNCSSNSESVKSESNPEPMPPVAYGVHIEEARELPTSPAAETSSSKDALKVNTELSNKLRVTEELYKKAIHGLRCLNFEGHFIIILTRQTIEMHEGNKKNISKIILEIEELLQFSQERNLDLSSDNLVQTYELLIRLSQLTGDTKCIASYCSKAANYYFDKYQNEVACGRMGRVCRGNVYKSQACQMSAYAGAAYEALLEPQLAIKFYELCMKCSPKDHMTDPDFIPSRLNQLTKANNSNSNYSSNLKSVKSESNPAPMSPAANRTHPEEARVLPTSPAAATSSSEDALKVNDDLSNKLSDTEKLYDKAINGLMRVNIEGQFIIILTKQKIEMEGYKTNTSKIIIEIEELLQRSQELNPNLDLSSDNLVQTYELLIRLSQLTGDTKRIASYCSKAANYNFERYQNEVACGRLKGICLGNLYKARACEMSAYAGAAYEALLEPQLAIKFYELCMKCNPRDRMTNPDLIPSRLNQLTSSEDIRELPKVNELSEKLKKALELDKNATEGFAALNFTAQFTNILLKQKDEMHEGYETDINEIIEDIEKLFRLNKYDFSDKFNMANVLVKLSILIGDTERTAKYCAILVKYFYENMSQPEYEEGARIMSAYAGAACEALGETQMAIECYKIYLDSKWTKNVGDRELIRSRLYYLYENCLSCDNDSEEAREFCRNYKLTNKFNEALRLHRDATRGKNIPKFIFELIAILNKQKNEINPGYETIIDEIIEDIEKLLPQCSELKPGVDDNLAQLYGLLISLSLLTGDNESIASYCSKVAKYYFEKDRWEEALDHLAGTNVGSGYNKETTHRMSAYAGAAYEALGRYQLAIEFYELCLKCNWKHDQESTDLVRARLNKLRSSNVSNYSSNRYALLGLIKIGTQPAATAPDAETQPGNAAPNAECLKPF